VSSQTPTTAKRLKVLYLRVARVGKGAARRKDLGGVWASTASLLESTGQQNRGGEWGATKDTKTKRADAKRPAGIPSSKGHARSACDRSIRS